MRTTSSLLLSLAAAALLAGCASGPTTYTTSVQSYSGMAGVQLPTTYRIELLPSQVQNQQSFGVIEASAQQALDQVGLRPAADPTQAHLVVQIDAISVANTTTPYNRLRVLRTARRLWLGLRPPMDTRPLGPWSLRPRPCHGMGHGLSLHRLPPLCESGDARCQDPAHRLRDLGPVQRHAGQ